MLTLLLGTDWTANRDAVLDMLAQDVIQQRKNRILIVPELISHDTERRLCMAAGDTASRFAEVLTFTRLAKRVSDAVGFGAPECLDNGGRLVAMASATRQLHSKLKAYAAVETQPAFLTGLLDAVDEFKRCCISPKDLYSASQKSEGSLAQKLEELSLILEAYDSLCARGKQDPRDQMTWLLEHLEDSDYAKNHVFYIDGFPDFTRQHTAILQHLIKESENVVISLTCDDLDTTEPAFEKAAQTAGEILRIALLAGVQTKILKIPAKEKLVKQVLPTLFQGRITGNEQLSGTLKVCHLDSVYSECHAAAERIVDLVQSGCRYRDIGIVCTDMSVYANTVDMVMSRYHIPVYQSGTEDILDKTVITTVLSAIDAVVDGYEQSDVLRYLKSALSPLMITECDRLENYAVIWSISGNRWNETWENHPEGLGAYWTDADREHLRWLNEIREKAIAPLFNLGLRMKNASTLGQMVAAVYDFLQDIQLNARLLALAEQMDREGDLRNGQILNQLWEILLSALEQLEDMLGDTHWDAQIFTKLLKLLLSQYDVGTIPAVLDAVTVGPVSAMRCQQTRHLLVLGADEGSFPAYSGSAGILSDQERTALRQLGVPLTGGAMEGLQAEFADIYGVFCGAEESIYVSASGSQPSYLYRRLCDLVGGETVCKPLGVSFVNPVEAGAYLSRYNDKETASAFGIDDIFHRLQSAGEHALGEMSDKTVEKLYGSKIRLSASQVDKLADCRLAYFLDYGLNLKERKQATIDPAEFGTYVHAVLEKTGRKVMELGGFHKVSLADTLNIAEAFSQEYMLERFSQLDSKRISYLFQRNAHELAMVVTELWEELQESSFEPVEFELAFGSNARMEPITVNGKTMSAELRGFVDRVDVWNENGQAYYRVVDYKTGKKDFDYGDIFNGLGLQMLLYLFALEEKGESLLGNHPVPAGVQYFPARAPVVAVDGKVEDAEAQQAREKLWKRKGLLLEDEAVLAAMEPAEKPKRLDYSRKKDGSISGELASREQLKLLKGYVFALLAKMVDDISSGNVEPNPYTRGSRHNACTYCPYGKICHDATVLGRRNYAAMSAQKFWEEIGKEMSSNGRKVDP